MPGTGLPAAGCIWELRVNARTCEAVPKAVDWNETRSGPQATSAATALGMPSSRLIPAASMLPQHTAACSPACRLVSASVPGRVTTPRNPDRSLSRRRVAPNSSAFCLPLTHQTTVAGQLGGPTPVAPPATVFLFEPAGHALVHAGYLPGEPGHPHQVSGEHGQHQQAGKRGRDASARGAGGLPRRWPLTGPASRPRSSAATCGCALCSRCTCLVAARNSARSHQRPVAALPADPWAACCCAASGCGLCAAARRDR